MKTKTQKTKMREFTKVRRDSNLKHAISEIDKKFGKGKIMRLGGNFKVNVPVISTGAISLDDAIGIGGIPKGRVTEIYGPPGGGKTTLALQVITQSQKKGGTVAFIDAEHAIDPVYAKTLGVDIDNLLISQPDTGEEALEIVDDLVNSGQLDCIVVDSVAALVPRAEIEGVMGQSHIGLQARLMSQALRKLTATVAKTGTSLVFINQTRMKVGMMGYGGNPETTSGGTALKFYASLRLDVRVIKTLKKDDQAYGTTVRVRVVKNKLAVPFKRAELEMIFGKGFNPEGSLLDFAISKNVVILKGAWYSFNGTRIGQGREKACENMKSDDKMRAEILKKVTE